MSRLRLSRLAALLLAALLLAALAARPVRALPTTLYDGGVTGQTPADQGSFGFSAHPSPPAAAAATYHDGGTTLDTRGALGDMAGFYALSGRVPELDRARGFTLRFSAQVRSETHLVDDRAGLSVILLGADQRGVELGFWADRVWAQADGPALFTQAEGAALDMAAPVAFALTVRGDHYSLAAGGSEVLAGPVRLYRPALSPQSPLGIFYYLPNFIFLGDNTSRAGAEVRLLAVSLEQLQPIPTPETSPQPAPAPGLTPRSYLPALVR